MSKREPKRTRRAAHYAELFGVSPRTIKRYAERYGWEVVKYDPAPTAPNYYYESEVLAFFNRKQMEAR